MSSNPHNEADDRPEAFPTLTPIASAASGEAGKENDGRTSLRERATSITTSIRRTRGSSLLQTFQESSLPLGMWQATGEVSSKIPTLPEIRDGSFTDEGWSHEGQLEQRNQDPHEIHRRRISSMSRRRGPRSDRATTLPERFQHLQDHAVAEETEGETYETSEDPDATRPLEKRTGTAPARLPSTELKKESTAITMSAPIESHTTSRGPDETGTYPNGYRFPKKHTWQQSLTIFSKAFWKFFCTPFGFCVTIYGLNVVAWGAMIFFVLLEAAPAMCHPSCNALNSARKKWIEYDSQILNALFCVTGFGLLPWRVRDFWYLMKWRVGKNHEAHRRLAGLYGGWYRLPGSEDLPEDLGPPSKEEYKKLHDMDALPDEEKAHMKEIQEHVEILRANKSVPLPVWKMSHPPLTGIRAATTKSYNLDIVIWMYILNSAFQVCLASFMWALNRFNRPSWATGLFITLGCLTGIFAGIVVFIEGKKVKKAEGIPVEEYDVLESIDDYQTRKAKEDAKEKKKEEKHERHQRHHSHERRVIRTEKVKGKDWFHRH